MASLSPLLLNNVYSTVQAGSSAIGSASATGVNVATGDGANFGTIGSNQYIPAVIVDTSTSPETIKEYVWITARSTDALTVTRQAEESTRYAASTTTIQAGYTIAVVGSVGALRAFAPMYWDPGLQGIGSSTMDPFLPTAGMALTSGALQLIRVPVPPSRVINKVWFGFSTGPTSLTSGQNFVGVYSEDGSSLLGSSADQSTAWAGGAAWQGVALTSPVTVAAGARNVFVAILVKASSAGQILSTAVASSLAAQWTNAGTGSLDRNVARSMNSGSALTSLPSSFTISGTGVNTQLPMVWLT